MKYIWQVIIGEKFPVWLTLIGAIIGAMGTYILIPRVNQNIEAQKIRTVFVISNLDDLNTRTRKFISNIGKLNRALIEDNRNNKKLIEDISEQIVELQWKALEFDVIFTSDTDKELLRKYKNSLTSIKNGISSDINADTLAKNNDNVKNFAEFTIRVLERIAEIGGIRPQFRSPQT